MKRVISLSAMALLLLSVGCLIQTPSTQIANAQNLHVSDFKFAAVGDWGCTADTSTTVKDIQNKHPELVLALGDLVIRTLEIAGFMTSSINNKLKIVMGNHDSGDEGYLTLLQAQYKNHFGLSNTYYSFI